MGCALGRPIPNDDDGTRSSQLLTKLLQPAYLVPEHSGNNVYVLSPVIQSNTTFDR
jgi:hypothetical protein